jgi:aerobic-type carbon monoxide dehydrogenase small subunit (CoxS/CutS family)
MLFFLKGDLPVISLTVNGIPVQSEEDITLLSFLRDSLGLTAAKDGCSEGVCGTCTVLVDGKKVKPARRRSLALKESPSRP